MTNQIQKPTIDLSTIEFPSDCLAIKQIRNLLLSRSDYSSGNPILTTDVEEIGHKIALLLDGELLVVNLAFGDIIQGKSVPDRDGLYGEYVKDLEKDYVALGIAEGFHTAEELVKKIEDQAVAQALRFSGRAL